MVFDNLHCLVPIFLIQLHGTVRRDAMRRQEGNHIACAPVLKIRVTYFSQLVFTDTRYGQQPFWLLIQHIQCTEAKCFINAFGNLRANAFDLTGRQVRNNPFLSRNQYLIIAFNLKLKPVILMLAPVPLHLVTQVACNRKAVTNRLHLRKNLSRCVLNLLTGTVQGDHVASRICLRRIRRIDHSFKLT